MHKAGSGSVKVDFTIELVFDEDQWWDCTHERALPEAVQVELRKVLSGEHSYELDFDVTADIDYDPGCHTMRNGDPGWPESYSDERSVGGIAILVNGKHLKVDGKVYRLPKTAADVLEKEHQKDIEDADLPETDYEGDRGDYEYDRWKDGD